jgi:hypothetical protein
MGVVPFNKRRGAGKASALQTALQRIVRALDRLVVKRSRRVVPVIALRRSDHDVRRCRQLMLEGSNDHAVSAAWPRS